MGANFHPFEEAPMRTFFHIILAMMALSGTLLARSGRRGYED